MKGSQKRVMTARFRDKVHAITRRVYRLGTVFEFGANTTRSMTSPILSTPVRLARVAGFMIIVVAIDIRMGHRSGLKDSV